MNAPARFELFDQDGETKITYTTDEKSPNTGTIRILKEDHTLGNLLRMQLLRDSNVIFAGYRNPHPLEHVIEVKIQTTEESSPKEAMVHAIDALRKEFDFLEDNVRKAYVRARQHQQTH